MAHLQLARDPRQAGNIIRNARKALNLSQGELAEKVGTRQATISLIESGSGATRLETILAILAALDLELTIGPRSRGPRFDAGGPQ
ncbi:MAG: transcriptional regulator, family [Betaproteobacteria bacterium]|nr:transcriptional regulator, family [Betaproteobacteria bacterium]